jgi:ubiquinone/menaquinone biosynthesis C-methylase UbiE
MNKKNDYAKQYHQINNWQYIRGEKLLGLIKHKKNETILDIGCGTGELSYKLANNAAQFNGNLLVTDTDSDRLSIALNNQPKNINNITYLSDSAEKLTNVKSNSVDIIYSNYVIHWIKNKNNMLSEFYRCLRPDGYCIFEFIESLPQFEREITLLTGISGENLVNNFHCINKEAWVELFTLFGFKIDYIDLPVLEYNFDSLDHFFDWWEGTTHGSFLRKDISSTSMKELRKNYNSKIVFEGTSLLFIVRKIE